MSIGQVKYVLTCVPTPSSADSYCGQIGGQNHVLALSEHVMLDPDMLPIFTELAEPFSPIYAAGVFGFFFSTVIAFWIVAKSAGSIIEAIRKF